MKFSVMIFTLVAASLISGCGYENAAMLAEEEKKNSILEASDHVDTLLLAPTFDSAKYAFRLSDAYKALGDTAATNRDRLAGGIIVAAGAAVLGAASSVGAAELAGVTIVGLGLGEAVRYTNQAGAAEAFYKTSDEMACLGSTTIGVIGSASHISLTDSAIVLEFIRRAELRLRSRLRRTVPDYNSVLTRFKDGLGYEAPQISGRTGQKPDLKTALETCLPNDPPADVESNAKSGDPAGSPGPVENNSSGQVETPTVVSPVL